MIRYKNVQQKLKEAGYNTSRLRKERLISDTTLARLRNNEAISMTTLNTICNLLKCRPEDVFEYIPDDEISPDISEEPPINDRTETMQK